jgi:hypothetical protein
LVARAQVALEERQDEQLTDEALVANMGRGDELIAVVGPGV